MVDAKRCIECGAELPASAPQGLCPKCLLQVGLGEAAGAANLRIRCPHCQNAVELVPDAPLADVTCPSCGSHFSLVDQPTVSYGPQEPKTIGHFDLLETIGTGAFGTVWKSRDKELDRTVAVKIPRKGQLSPDEAEQFLREARAAAQLRHPNIVSVHEVGHESGQLYIVSDFVEGVSLADWLTGQQATPREAAELCAKIADALQHAHEAGVIHRDLKPSNIILARSSVGSDRIHAAGVGKCPDESGHYQQGPDKSGHYEHEHFEPHIMDFGLAKREAGEITMTVEGKILGTPAYMSPEQARGEAHSADRRADVYSVGVILFELLTGEKPFRGNTRMLLDQVINEDAPSPRKLNARIPRDLETICLKCLEKHPVQRYQTAADFAGDLWRWLRGEPIHARPLSVWQRGWRRARRRPVAAALLLVTVVAMLSLGGLITGAVYNVQLQHSLRDTRAAKQLAEEALQGETNALHREEQQRRAAGSAQGIAEVYRYLRGVALAHAAWREGNVGRTERLLDDSPVEHRNWEWRYLKRLCHSDLLTFDQHTGAVYCVAFSPDGERIASGSSDRTIKIWDATTGEVALTLQGHSLPVVSLAFGPEGRRLVSAGAKSNTRLGELKLWDATTGQEILNIEGHTKGVLSVAFSPDGQQVASISGDDTLRVWDATSGQELLKITDHGPFKWPLRVAFSPDGKRLASSSASSVMVWDAKTGQKLQTFKAHGQFVDAVAFSPDSQRIASGDFNGVIKIWEAGTGQEVLTLTGHTRSVTSVAFSRDGKRLASAGSDETVRVWDAATGQVIHTLKGHTGSVTSVQFSPDGQRLASASADHTVKLWDAMGEQEATSLTDAGAGRELPVKDPPSMQVPITLVRSALFSPSGDQIAWFGYYGMTVHITSTKGEDVIILRGHSKPITCIAFGPTGKRFATAGGDQTVRLWDTASGNEELAIGGPNRGIFVLVFSPDGTKLASVGDYERLTIWDALQGQKMATLGTKSVYARSLAFSPDSKQVVLGDRNGTIWIWDVASRRELFEIKGHDEPVTGLAFSPDGRKLASHGGTLKLWDTTSGDEILTFKERHRAPETGVSSTVSFSPEGTRLASVGVYQTVNIWDVMTGELVLSLEGTKDDGLVASVAFSPAGNRLFAGFGTTAKIWNATPLSR